ncbi:glutathione S-transferase family protein [Pseudoalteromonas ulvae]|uniref:glutathione transferase n=1 Tax=Pseudoalteromonas ulvae TaxID=107327 RepID=A0A244CLJ3_PSEDV|nr:glutathione S-transferase family protein [Pseudoalteromonas ulvae]OUL56408.1 glutathione S-transferase [Pseudoalteromonas ulvae]
MITLHHLNQSRSQRIVWLLEELGTPYELVHHQRDPITRLAPPSLHQVHPLGKAPILSDNTLILCESAAIIEYLLDTDDNNALRPEKGTHAYYSYLQWMHFAEGSLALPLITNMLMGMEDRDGKQPMDGYIKKELNLDLAFIEMTLSKQAYFAGEHFSAADIMMTFLLNIAANAMLLEQHPHTRAYLTKVQQRPAYAKAQQQG